MKSSVDNKSWVIGNWKLNPTSQAEVKSLVDNLQKGIQANQDINNQCHVMVAPSHLHLSTVKQKLLTDDSIQLVCQDLSALTSSSGAFTGDVSAEQLSDLGVEWAIIGHSERRQFYNEDNDLLLKKLQHCANQNLGIILCIGESESDFDDGHTNQVLSEQLAVVSELLSNITASESATKENDTINDSTVISAAKLTENLIIAYEPVWAIGTGKVPSVDEVTKVHQFIRNKLISFNPVLSDTPIIYGGSVKPENAADFASSEEINGVLVGGAALNADSFIDIAIAFSK